MTYVILSMYEALEADGELVVISAADPLTTESVSADSLADALTFEERGEAHTMMQLLVAKDEGLFPPVWPVLAEVVANELVVHTDMLSEQGERKLRELAESKELRIA